MINIIKAKYKSDRNIELFFSDGSYGTMDFSDMLEKKTSLTIPLEAMEYFKSFFIDFGALCWKNGLEFSAASLQEKLKKSSNLHKGEEVA